MARDPNDYARFMIETARGMASPVMTNAYQEWLRKVDEADSYMGKGLETADDLIRLLCEFYIAERLGMERVALIAVNSGNHLDRPPMPLISALICAMSESLVGLDLGVVPVLLSRYRQLAPEAVERLCILRTLADIGDPGLKGFFEGLAEELTPCVRASDEITARFFHLLNVFHQVDPEPPQSLSDSVEQQARFLLKRYNFAVNERLSRETAA
jgi:hypothetical protein